MTADHRRKYSGDKIVLSANCQDIYAMMVAFRGFIFTWPLHRLRWFAILFLLLPLLTNAQQTRNEWVDSVFNALSEEDKIGQLLVMTISSHAEQSDLNPVERAVNNSIIGGLLISGGDVSKHMRLVNELQSRSATKLLIGIDAPDGLRSIDGALHYPQPLAQSAFDNDSLVYLLGRRIAYEMRLLGIHVNTGLSLNSVSSVATHLQAQTFGNDPSLIARKALAFSRGLADEGVLAFGKHFQLQGLTVKDYVKDVPVVETFADTAEVRAISVLVSSNTMHGILPASRELPLVIEKKSDVRKNKLSSGALSLLYANQWLKNRLQFEGLVVADLRMIGGSQGKLRGGDAEMHAFIAGNDMIITADNPAAAVRRIRRFLRKNSKYKLQLDQSVRKILNAKYLAGLATYAPSVTENIDLKLRSPEARVFQRNLLTSSITILKNDDNILPVRSLENRNFATISLADTATGNGFQKTVSKYVFSKHFVANTPAAVSSFGKVATAYDVIIAVVNHQATRPQLDTLVNIYRTLDSLERELIVVDLGCSFIAEYSDKFKALVTGFSDDRHIQPLMAQAVFGAVAIKGKYPLTKRPAIVSKDIRRLQYSFPEDAGLSASTLNRIDMIAREAIDIGGTPGCHVFVARNGKVIYEKSYGHYTYEKVSPVTDSTLYDLASVTKVSATLQSVMFLYDRGMIDLYRKASFYLPELATSNKKDATLKDILMHQAGLWPFLPFWAQTMKDSVYLPAYYSRQLSAEYPIMVSQHLYGSRSMPDSLWQWTIRSKLREKPTRTPFDYKYSDMSFYILHRLAERLLNQPMDDFLSQNLYEPLGAYTTGYTPLLRFPVSRIAPTENDRLFRKSLLVGTVHDQGAAMHGGVAGHAGLFSTANDLGKLGQMLLQDGYYGGYQYYKPETVRLFARKQFNTSKRGLGWDRPTPSDNVGVTSVYASQNTFGHTGFTGTCIWIDPDFQLVYIFLSNRVHPDMTNNKLLNANIRSRIQDVIYESIFDYCSGGRRPLFSSPQIKSAENSASNNN